jgi:hypothetical protein
VSAFLQLILIPILLNTKVMVILMICIVILTIIITIILTILVGITDIVMDGVMVISTIMLISHMMVLVLLVRLTKLAHLTGVAILHVLLVKPGLMYLLLKTVALVLVAVDVLELFALLNVFLRVNFQLLNLAIVALHPVGVTPTIVLLYLAQMMVFLLLLDPVSVVLLVNVIQTIAPFPVLLLENLLLNLILLIVALRFALVILQ